MKIKLIVVFIIGTIGGIYYLNRAEGKFCGGIAANLPENQCPIGYVCRPEGNYPDAGGKCVNILKSLFKSTPPKQPTIQVSSSTSANPAPTGTGETANWKTYTNTKYGYSLNYPTTLKTDEETSYSTLFNIIPPNGCVGCGGGNFPTFYVSVIPDSFKPGKADIYNYPTTDFLSTLFSLPIGNTKPIYPNAPSSCNWTRLQNTTLDGNNAAVYETHPCTGGISKDRRVFLKKNGNIYMIGSYYDKDEESKRFDLFLYTFKFTQ